MLDYQPDYRALYNPQFLRRADKKNAIRARAAEEQKTAEDRKRREAEAKASLEYEIEQAKIRRRRQMAEQLRRQKLEGIERARDRKCVRATYSSIEARIAKATGVTINEIRGARRQRQVALVRQAIAYWVIRRTGLSYPQVARLMGGRCHTTIVHAVQIYPEKRAKEGKFRRKAR